MTVSSKVKKVKASSASASSSGATVSDNKESKELSAEQVAKLNEIYKRRGLTNPGIKRMSRRAGVAHLQVAGYRHIRDITNKLNIKVLTKANAVLAYSKRCTMKGKQIRYGIIAVAGDNYMIA